MCVIRLFKYESFLPHAHLLFLQSDDKLRRMLKAAKEEHAKVRVYLQIFRMPILLQWLSANTFQALNGVRSESKKLEEQVKKLEGLLAESNVRVRLVRTLRYEY